MKTPVVFIFSFILSALAMLITFISAISYEKLLFLSGIIGLIAAFGFGYVAYESLRLRLIAIILIVFPFYVVADAVLGLNFGVRAWWVLFN